MLAQCTVKRALWASLPLCFNAGLSLLPRMRDIVIRIYDKKQLYFHLFESWIKTIYLFQLTEFKEKKPAQNQRRLVGKKCVAVVPFQATHISNLLQILRYFFFLFQTVNFFFYILLFLAIRGCLIFEFRVAFVRMFCTCKEFFYTPCFFFVVLCCEKQRRAFIWRERKERERRKKADHRI